MNFDFLKGNHDFKKLYEYCSEAEEFVYSKPNISATAARKAMEYLVKFIYTSILGEAASNGLTAFEMITDARFTDYINDPTVISSIHYIRKMGNVAVHDGTLTNDESMKVLEELQFLVGETAILLGLCDDYPQFSKNIAPTKPASRASVRQQETKKEKIIVEPELVAKYAPRMRATRFNTTYKRDEEENKKLFLHASLREAGWPIVNKPDQAMPSSVGIDMLLDDGGKVDYVLYGRDNRPLAVVEYSTTTQNLIAGRNKAIEQANKMSVKYGYKPIVYYTNGYHIYIIDQLGYKPRRVFQFHSIEELELLKLRVGIRQDISAPVIDDNITNRQYQKDAITATCNAFMQNRRHSLLVMATGTGKTRV